MPKETVVTPAEHAAAVADNYSKYVAKDLIYVHGALAYGPGHPVSALSVEDGTVPLELVEKVPAKAADSLPAVANPPVQKG